MSATEDTKIEELYGQLGQWLVGYSAVKNERNRGVKHRIYFLVLNY